jgi:hypothetical protein
MSDDKDIPNIPCSCEENGGIPHSHRNPPYSTEERTALMQKRQAEHVPIKHKMEPFDDSELNIPEIEAEAKAFGEDIIRQRKGSSSLATWLKEEAEKK